MRNILVERMGVEFMELREVDSARLRRLITRLLSASQDAVDLRPLQVDG